VSILVDEKGRAIDPKVEESSGNDKFDHDALKTVLKWKFESPLCEGQVRPTRIAVEIMSRVAK